MADIVDEAAAALRRMLPAERDSMASAILQLAEGSEPLDIAPEHLPAVLEGLAQIERGEFVEGEPEALVAAAFARARA